MCCFLWDVCSKGLFAFFFGLNNKNKERGWEDDEKKVFYIGSREEPLLLWEEEEKETLLRGHPMCGRELFIDVRFGAMSMVPPETGATKHTASNCSI